MIHKIFNKTSAAIFVAATTLWRAYLSATMQLHPDEAYYWLWSRHLDFGYYDHSPLVAYFIKSTTLFSQSELSVRLSSIIGLLIITWLLWKLAMEMFESETAAAASVILFNSLPLVMSGSIIITPDQPAFFFWSISVYLAWELVRTKKSYYWYLLGAAFGLSLLSKYTAVLFAPSLFLFIIFSEERKWLKTPHPYIALALGFAFFLPVVYWNSLHEWISFKFQLGHGLAGQQYSPVRLIEYIGGQMMVAGPVLFAAGIYASFVYLFRKDKKMLFLSLMTLPILLFFAYSSLKKSAGPNWPAFAYFSFSLIAGAYLTEGGKARNIILALSVITSFLLSFTATLHARFGIIPLHSISKDMAEADATQFFHGYRELGREILRHPEIRFALTSSHQLSAEIAYYTKEQVYAYIDPQFTRLSQFNYWGFPKELADKDGLYIYLEGDGVGPYNDYFYSTGEIIHLNVRRGKYPLRNYRMIKGVGFKPAAEEKKEVEKLNT